jgi:hypothetical protein
MAGGPWLCSENNNQGPRGTAAFLLAGRGEPGEGDGWFVLVEISLGLRFSMFFFKCVKLFFLCVENYYLYIKILLGLKLDPSSFFFFFCKFNFFLFFF